jgi:branched-chain amino acid transport system substrate-binding protein
MVLGVCLVSGCAYAQNYGVFPDKIVISHIGPLSKSALSNSSNSLFLRDLAGQGRGVVVMQVVPSPLSYKYAISREFKAAATQAKAPITYGAMQGWVSARLMVEGLKRAGKSPTPESLTQALESLQNFNMGDFVINFGPKQRAGSRYVEPTIINYANNFTY